MTDMLEIVVGKLTLLGFVDDEFRNNTAGNREVGLQYYFKRNTTSSWEVYVSFNPHSSLLTIYYFDAYSKDRGYPVGFISIKNQNDALIACDLLESKANYLWQKTSANTNRSKADTVVDKIKRMGFHAVDQTNSITTLKKKYPGYELTAMVESSVSLSVFVFKNKKHPEKDYPILSVRNIHEESALEVVYNYLSNFHKTAK